MTHKVDLNLKPIAIRTIELDQPLQPLDDVTEYATIKFVVTRRGRALGSFEIDNRRQAVSLARLRQALVENLGLKLLDLGDLDESLLWSRVITSLCDGLLAREAGEAEELPVREASEAKGGTLIDLSSPLQPLTGLEQQSQVNVTVARQGHPLGPVRLRNHNQAVSAARLFEEKVNDLGLNILEPERKFSDNLLWAKAVQLLHSRYEVIENPGTSGSESLPADVPVSVVVATYDRPDDLRRCLADLVAQETPRYVEIVVVDNHPASGLTPPVVAEYPGVVLVDEMRQGLSYARNAGIVASTGEIIIATDDDVILPPEWLEALVEPFARSDVMVVTGNVLPWELETPAQRYFELYGGLGRGFEPFEANADWFEAYRFRIIPTWKLGATANAAFRASIFNHPQIGLMEECLGTGMPSGCSEDTYLFYKVLKAGFTIIYQPAAFVWHKHRRTMAAFRKQLYNYSKGGVAFHLHIFLKDHDFRALIRIFVELPLLYGWRFNEWLHRRSTYPPSFLLLEAIGNLAGFWSLWRSWRRVKREGRSGPYVPVSQRSFPIGGTAIAKPHAAEMDRAR